MSVPVMPQTGHGTNVALAAIDESFMFMRFGDKAVKERQEG